MFAIQELTLIRFLVISEEMVSEFSLSGACSCKVHYIMSLSVHMHTQRPHHFTAQFNLAHNVLRVLQQTNNSKASKEGEEAARDCTI